MNGIELLAPAGNMESLTAAVENGADAIYLGGKNFSARQYANNFEGGQMIKAIDYCHVRGVRVYVTLNILLKDAELYDVPQYAAFLHNAGVDGLIIQDLGVGKLIQSILPDMELHASTQMTAHNLEGVNLLYGMGYKRVVLSRELSLGEIEEICRGTDAEIEVFAHGALCICYSGQCLMSSMIGGRSGNRGRCAQPCRMHYSLKAGKHPAFSGYVLSPRDLSTIEHIEQMIKSGVRSFKIEGRMKSPEYVAAVISVYRKAIDRFYSTGFADVSEDDKKELLMAFNRGGFTTAHLFGKSGREMMSLERPKNWGIYIGKLNRVYHDRGKAEISLKDKLSRGDGIEIWVKNGDNIGYTVSHLKVGNREVESAGEGERVLIEYRGGSKGDDVYKTLDAGFVDRLRKTYKGSDPARKVAVSCSAAVEEGKPAMIELSDSDGNNAEVSGPVPERAVSVPLTRDKLTSYLSKMGGTPYYISSLSVKLDSGLSLPVSAINSLRRQAVEKLTAARIAMHKSGVMQEEQVRKKAYVLLKGRHAFLEKELKLSVYVRDMGLVDSAIEGGADIIIFGGDMLKGCSVDYAAAVKKCTDNGVEIYVATPRIMRREFYDIMDSIYKAVHDVDNAGIYADNIGGVRFALERSVPFAAGFSLNIFNYMSAEVFTNLKSMFVSISPELSVEDIKQFAPYIKNCEALCYGRVEMMVSEYCPSGALFGCSPIGSSPVCTQGAVSLTDRMGMDFPVRTDIYCRSHIYNSKVLSMLNDLRDIADSGVNIFRLNMLEEDGARVRQIVSAFREAISCIKTGVHSLPEGVLKTADMIKDRGYTRGHYYRGVE